MKLFFIAVLGFFSFSVYGAHPHLYGSGLGSILGSKKDSSRIVFDLEVVDRDLNEYDGITIYNYSSSNLSATLNEKAFSTGGKDPVEDYYDDDSSRRKCIELDWSFSYTPGAQAQEIIGDGYDFKSARSAKPCGAAASIDFGAEYIDMKPIILSLRFPRSVPGRLPLGKVNMLLSYHKEKDGFLIFNKAGSRSSFGMMFGVQCAANSAVGQVNWGGSCTSGDGFVIQPEDNRDHVHGGYDYTASGDNLNVDIYTGVYKMDVPVAAAAEDVAKLKRMILIHIAPDRIFAPAVLEKGDYTSSIGVDFRIP